MNLPKKKMSAMKWIVLLIGVPFALVIALGIFIQLSMTPEERASNEARRAAERAEKESARSAERADRQSARAAERAASEAASKAELGFTADQEQFFALNKTCYEAFRQGKNEIQKSLSFNDCNKQRQAFAAQNQISNWTGVISNISTDQGADVVAVDVVAEIDGFEIAFSTVNNRFSDMNTNSMITQQNPLFGVVAQMEEGDKVNFSATFLQDPTGGRGIWESSMTEKGSMSDPDFSVRFSDIRPFVAAKADSLQPAVDVGTASEAPTVGAPAPKADYPNPPANSEKATPDELAASCVELGSKMDAGTATQRQADDWIRFCLDDDDDGNEKTPRPTTGPSTQVVEVARPSFDCAKASALTERMICADAPLATLDRELAAEYSRVRAGTSDKDSLRNEQNAWRRDSRDACRDAGCVRGAYEQRLMQLRSR